MRTTKRSTNTGGEKIRGEVTDWQTRSADFWGTGVCRTRQDGGDVKISGKLLGAKVGDTVELEGWYDDHARYGRQFKFRACTVVLPVDASGVVSWLASTLPQISRRRAEAIVAAHGIEGTWALLDRRDVAALCEIDGITKPRAEEICAAYIANKRDRDRLVRFKGWGLTDGQIAKLIEEWGDDVEERITRNPYDVIKSVPGFGWVRADELAQRMGVKRNDPGRIEAGVMHFMSLGVQEGHCRVPHGKVVSVTAAKILGGVAEPEVAVVVRRLLDDGVLVPRGTHVYTRRLAMAEDKLAKAFSERVGAQAEKDSKGRAA